MISNMTFNIVVDGMTAIVIIFMIISLLSNKMEKDTGDRAFFLGILMSISQCIIDIMYWLVNGNENLLAVNYLINYLYILCGFLSFVFYSYYEFSVLKLSTKLAGLLVNIYAVICLLSWSSMVWLTQYGYCFYFDNGVYQRGEYWWLTVGVPIAGCLLDCVVILLSHAKATQRITFAVFSVLPATGLAIGYLFPNISTTQMVLLLSASLLYINSYVDTRNALHKNEIALQESRMEVMISQIQPHFLYNSISSAVALCRIDPEKAAEVMANFGKYLRGNLDSLRRKEPILFRDELNHIKAYVELEKTRLDEALNVTYDIEVSDFLIPALSVQPMVENAIKHGIAEAGVSGEVKVSAWEEFEDFIVEVRDNGCGFDPSKPCDDGKVHIGILNVKNRLDEMVRGTLTIVSKPGQGTVATIRIPKQYATICRIPANGVSERSQK